MPNWLTKADAKLLSMQFGLRRQADFLENIFLLMEDGIAIRDALRLVAGSDAPIDRNVARHMLDRIQEGLPLSSSMSGLFRRDVIGAVAAAEQSETFAKSGLNLVEHLREHFKTYRQVAGKLLRPIPYLAFAVGLYVMFAVMIWPRFEIVSSPETWHPMAYVNYTIGLFVADYWLWLLVAPMVVAYLAWLLLRRWVGLGRQTLDRIWPFSLYRNIAAVNVISHLSVMLIAGHDFRAALTATARNATPHSLLYLNQMNHYLRAGYSIPRALDVGLFTKNDMNRLKILAEFKGLYTALVRMSATSRETALAKLRVTATVLNTIGLALVALSYALLVVSLYLNATNMQQQMMTL